MAKMNEIHLNGIIPIIPTPFNAEELVDWPALGRLSGFALVQLDVANDVGLRRGFVLSPHPRALHPQLAVPRREVGPPQRNQFRRPHAGVRASQLCFGNASRGDCA